MKTKEVLVSGNRSKKMNKSPKFTVMVVALLGLLAVKTASADARFYCPSALCFLPPQQPLTFNSAAQAFAYADAPWAEDLVGTWSVSFDNFRLSKHRERNPRQGIARSAAASC